MNRHLIGLTTVGLIGAAMLGVTSARADGLSVSAGSGGVGASAGAGGAAVGLSAGTSGDGVAAGGRIDAGGGNTAQTGANVGGGGASAGSTASTSAGGGSAGAGASTSGGGGGDGSGSSGGSARSDSGSGGGTGASTTAAAAEAQDVAPAAPPQPAASGSAADATLPDELRPRDRCAGDQGSGCAAARPTGRDVDRHTPEYVGAITALASFNSAPQATVTACRNGIIEGARPYDPVQVDAVSAGEVVAVNGGGHLAPLVVRIVYAREGGYEIREAEVQCQLDAAGTVVALV